MTADSYPISRMEEMIDELGQNTIFSILDARSAYWSIELNPDDRPKTSFSDGTNLCQFRRMPYGLKTAGTTYQRMINFILSPVLSRHAMAYLNDIVIYSKNFNDHMQHLGETLHLIEQAGFKLNPNKCKFGVQELKLLGFVVSPHGVTPDTYKIASIASMTAPHNVREVRRFLGASGFFRRHIANYANIAAPLTSLTRKDNKFHWDASNVAIGACLMQRVAGKPYAVAYYSKKLKGAEVRYCTTDAEALAVLEGEVHHVPDLLSRAVAAIDLSAIDPNQFRAMQLEDPLCREIVEFVEGKALPCVKIPSSLDEFEVNNGILYHVRELPKYVHSCPTCQRRKTVLRGRAPLAANPLATEPFERVSVDLIDLPVASNGDRYVLTIVDELTRFIQRVFREVCELLGTKTRYTTPYNPASNGLVERCNRVIKDCLAALCEETPNTWNTRLEYMRLALYTAFHRSVNNQPLYLLTGRDCIFPVGLTNHHTRDGDIGKRQLDLLAARDAAVTGTQKVREENMKGVDRRTKAIPELREGSLILRKKPPGQGRAGLASRWIGPLRIIKKVGPVSYIVKDLTKYTEHRVHRNQIIPFKIDNELRILMPEGVVQPGKAMVDSGDIDPDDPINVMLLGLVRSPDASW
ncbi:uncharacterized protein LOC125026223 [Penaeus chinensis]|uniref:uncharacterized protein LOC125026223 n=1 Tax=Penaeus chinensis TaxID=139456 RepID=UPI001FB7B7B0|nr:uncharacterized protein LOC125026223 [Penaeus chinensis]